MVYEKCLYTFIHTQKLNKLTYDVHIRVLLGCCFRYSSNVLF